jgi:hypothetical protein
MINISITKSNEADAIGVYDFYYNIVHIGRSRKNDVIVLDKELPLFFLKLEIIEEKGREVLVVRSQDRLPYFFVNGKKISGTLKLKRNDTISFGNNHIVINNFQKTSLEEDITPIFNEFEAKTPELKFILEAIEEKLIELEST